MHPKPINNPSSLVALTRCPDYRPENIAPAVTRQISLLGGLDKFISPGDTVLLKPNFIAPKPRRFAVQTDPEIILALARLLKDLGARPFVGDSPAWGNTHACIKALDLEEPLRKLNVPVKQLNHPQRLKIAGSRLGLSAVALEADKIINLPKFKSHQQLVATFAVKNMFGCVSGKEKAFWHFAKGKHLNDFCRMLIEIYQRLSPALTIIDAVVAMDGPGPISGNPKPLGFLIAGADPIACEALCCRLININPDELPLLQTAAKIGFGCSDLSRIEFAGDDYTDFICPDFDIPPQIPLRFSLARVCKSLAKQFVLLARHVT